MLLKNIFPLASSASLLQVNNFIVMIQSTHNQLNSFSLVDPKMSLMD